MSSRRWHAKGLYGLAALVALRHDDDHAARLAGPRPRSAPTSSQVPLPILFTAGETSPAWLRRTPAAVAARAGIPTRTISGAGHSPHLTHPDALVAVVEDFTGARM